MRIKGDFITNSSSTNFFFVFKGPRCVRSLKQAITNHKEKFNLTSPGWEDIPTYSCTHEDIIQDIERVVRERLGEEEWNKIKVISLDKEIENIEEEMEHYRKELKEEQEKESKDKKQHSESYVKLIKDLLTKEQKKKNKYERAKKNGFENFFRMGWGDNHGEVAGGNSGNAMDYEGRNIAINDDDLIVFTEQNR